MIHSKDDRKGDGRFRIEKIIALVKSGDQAALGDFYRLIAPKMKAYAYVFLRNLEESEDVVQDVFLRTIPQLYKVHGSVEAYMFRSVKNRCLDLARKDKMRDQHLSQPKSSHTEQPFFPQLIDEKELLDRCEKILNELEFQVFLLTRKGYKPKDIAYELNKTNGNIRVILHGARNKLKQDPIIRAYYE